MRILIISDTHGDFECFERVLDKAGNTDLIIHAGDYLYHGPRNCIPEGYAPGKLAETFRKKKSSIYGVRGNCDSDVDLMVMGFSELPRQLEIALAHRDMLVHHGDLAIQYSPRDYDLVISGHTHIASISRQEKTIFLNPGSPSLPKDSTKGTFAIWETHPSGSIGLFDLDGELLSFKPF